MSENILMILKDNPFTPIVGEGGYNSGKSLTASNTELSKEERRKLQNRNANVVYRASDRKHYNDRIKNYLENMKPEAKEKRKIAVKRANDKYRKRLQATRYSEMQDQYINKEVKRLLRKNVDYDGKVINKRGRIPGKTKEERDANIEARNKANYDRLYKEVKTRLDKKYLVDTDGSKVELIPEGEGERREPWAEVVLDKLQVGDTPMTRDLNLQNLKLYFNNNIAPTNDLKLPVGISQYIDEKMTAKSKALNKEGKTYTRKTETGLLTKKK